MMVPRAAGASLVLACASVMGCGGAGSEEVPEGTVEEASMAEARSDQGTAPNRLTEEERAAGWRLLFDGETLSGWRGFRREDPPGSWSAVGGTLAFQAGDDRGDLVTDEAFADFELALEWKISPGGNSGIMFRVTEDHEWPWQSGAEMQVLDNGGHADGASPLTSAGSNYALHPPVADVTRPVGEWNEVRLVVDGSHVEHWLNGTKIVEYELWSDEWKTLVAASKFGEMPAYGMAAEGHLCLQDHGDPVWFRNIKIRPL